MTQGAKKSRLVVEVIADTDDRKIFVLVEDFKLLGFVVPSGYRTDFASVPRFFWRIFPPIGRYCQAAVLHDWLCDTKPRSYQETHQLFDKAMLATGVGPKTRKTMAWAVKRFGPRW